MNLQVKRFGSPSPSRRAGPLAVCQPRDRGYAFLILIMLTTVLLISLTAALPSVYVAGQREREEELIFRGTQYARAISLFHRQFGRYPTSVKELLKTDGIRFLRRAYPDPMTRSGKWRFIHADASGILLDSRIQRRASATGEGPESSPAHSPEQAREPSASFGEGTEIQGAFLAGVASSSRRESIRVWNGRSHYDEWEFVGVGVSPNGKAPPASASILASPTPPAGEPPG